MVCKFLHSYPFVFCIAVKAIIVPIQDKIAPTSNACEIPLKSINHPPMIDENTAPPTCIKLNIICAYNVPSSSIIIFAYCTDARIYSAKETNCKANPNDNVISDGESHTIIAFTLNIIIENKSNEDTLKR